MSVRCAKPCTLVVHVSWQSAVDSQNFFVSQEERLVRIRALNSWHLFADLNCTVERWVDWYTAEFAVAL